MRKLALKAAFAAEARYGDRKPVAVVTDILICTLHG